MNELAPKPCNSNGCYHTTDPDHDDHPGDCPCQCHPTTMTGQLWMLCEHGEIKAHYPRLGLAADCPGGHPVEGGELKALVDEQAEDEGLWFMARTAPEAYLQQELRCLHDAVERFLIPLSNTETEK